MACRISRAFASVVLSRVVALDCYFGQETAAARISEVPGQREQKKGHGLKAQHLAWVGFFASDHLASRSFGHVDERFKTFRLIRIEIERVDLTKMMASLDFFAGHASPKKPQVICLEESRAVRMRL